MLKIFRKRMQDDKGFTLIELMVVVLIIAILLAIAIPTFLGLRARAQDRAAQSNLRNALTAAKAHYTDNETYTGLLAAAPAIEPSLQWVDGAPAAVGAVGIRQADGNLVTLEALSASDTRFCIADSLAAGGPGTVRGVGAAADFGTCQTNAAANGW